MNDKPTDPEVLPLGPVTKNARGFEQIKFCGMYGGGDYLEQSVVPCFDPPLPVVTIGDRCGGDGERVYLDAELVQALIAHLQAWLATGSFEIIDVTPTKPIKATPEEKANE